MALPREQTRTSMMETLCLFFYTHPFLKFKRRSCPIPGASKHVPQAATHIPWYPNLSISKNIKKLKEERRVSD